MAQRCSNCGKTEKQHKGKICIAPKGHWEGQTSNPFYDNPMYQYYKTLQDLLAIIHRDGGQYTARHGMSKSVTDAIAKCVTAFVK